MPLPHTLFRPLAALLLAAAVTAPAHAADRKSGQSLAQAWCSPCHAVKGAEVATDQAPPLSVIGTVRTADWLRAFLTRPHPPMPPLSLSREHIDDLVAYIETVGD